MLAGSISLNFKEVGGPSLSLSATAKSIMNPLLLFVSTLNIVLKHVSVHNAHLMMSVMLDLKIWFIPRLKKYH